MNTTSNSSPVSAKNLFTKTFFPNEELIQTYNSRVKLNILYKKASVICVTNQRVLINIEGKITDISYINMQKCEVITSTGLFSSKYLEIKYIEGSPKLLKLFSICNDKNEDEIEECCMLINTFLHQ